MTTTPEPGPTSGEADALTADQAVLDEAAAAIEDVVEGELSPQDAAAMERLDVPRRLLLVHAHPDDETIATGGTMARYAAASAHVTLVTCTRGERGEVIPAELAHLSGDALGEHRTGELAAAMEALGVGDHRFLGADAVDGEGRPQPVRFRDSGMLWTDVPGVAGVAADVAHDAFSLVDVDVAAAHLVRVLREVRPQVVVTYEPGGGYGHPDHVHAHRVTTRAVELAREPGHDSGEPWDVAKVYWVVVPRSSWEQAGEAPVAAPPLVVDDERVTTEIDVSAHRDARAAALRAHATQVDLQDGGFRLSNGSTVPVRAVEHYVLAHGHASPVEGGREQDLFAGLA